MFKTLIVRESDNDIIEDIYMLLELYNPDSMGVGHFRTFEWIRFATVFIPILCHEN